MTQERIDASGVAFEGRPTAGAAQGVGAQLVARSVQRCDALGDITEVPGQVCAAGWRRNGHDGQIRIGLGTAQSSCAVPAEDA